MWNFVSNSADFILGANDGRSKGTVTTQRALVHVEGDELHVNFAGDFEAGTVIGGPKVTMTGNVGIGTSAPTSILDLVDISGTYTSGVTPWPTATITLGGRWYTASASPIPSGGIRGWHTSTDGSYGGGVQLLYTPNGSSTLTPGLNINHTGNIGIGTTTPNFHLSFGNNTNNPTIALFEQNGGNWYGVKLTNSDSSYRTGMFANGVEALSITSTGLVGVGSTVPGAKLDVKGNLKVSATGVVVNGVISELIFNNHHNDTGHTTARIKAVNRDATWSDRADIAFFTGVSASYERMRIRENGSVGIGTPDPAYTLHVNGSAGLSSGTAWTLASDLRLKDVDGVYEYGLEELKKLRTVRYHYKQDNPVHLPHDQAMVGFIAQEVRDVIPDAVKERADGYLELNVDPIHWATVNAVKELAAEKDAEIAQLKAQAAQLKAQAAGLQVRADKAEAETAAIKRAFCAKFPDLNLCSHHP